MGNIRVAWRLAEAYRRVAVVIVLMSTAGAGAIVAQSSAGGRGASLPATACASDTTYHPFDFWIGRWAVQDSAGKALGTDEVSPIMGGCAFVELWHDADGSEGQSLFYYATDQRRWKQVWVTPSAPLVGGYKEKRLIAKRTGEMVRFQGEVVGPRAIILDRTTLTSLSGGRVYQAIEISRDGGATWFVNFNAIYVPRSAKER